SKRCRAARAGCSPRRGSGATTASPAWTASPLTACSRPSTNCGDVTMGRNRLKVAVIGCGAVVERFHGPALSTLVDLGEVEVVALCDPDAARLGAVAKSFPRAATLTSVSNVAATQPDLALIASPAGMHADQSIALLEAGIHVLCEKPIAARTTDAERMIASAVRARRVLAVGLFRRFYASTRLVRGLVVSGRLGP